MKRTVAIVAGGFSSEHDVSLRSAAGILSFMNKERYDCYVVDVERDSWTAICGDERCAVDKNDFSFTASDGKHVFDFAFVTIHGTPGEDGPIQGYFDLLGIPYSTSNLLVEALTFNKYVLNTYLRSYPDIHISDSILLRRGEPASSSRCGGSPRSALFRQAQCRRQQLRNYKSKNSRGTARSHRQGHARKR